MLALPSALQVRPPGIDELKRHSLSEQCKTDLTLFNILSPFRRRQRGVEDTLTGCEQVMQAALRTDSDAGPLKHCAALPQPQGARHDSTHRHGSVSVTALGVHPDHNSA